MFLGGSSRGCIAQSPPWKGGKGDVPLGLFQAFTRYCIGIWENIPLKSPFKRAGLLSFPFSVSISLVLLSF